MSKVPDVIRSAIEKAREMVDANTVVGAPVAVADGVTLVPISRISVGVGGGGADLASKTSDGNFGGGAGCGVKVTPVAMLVVQNEHVRMLPIGEPASSAAERMVEQLPILIDKLTELVSGRDSEI